MAQKRDSFFLPNKKGKQVNHKDKKDAISERKDKRQDNFDKNRDVQQEHEEKHDGGKRPFDKKAYRLKKYSKKFKLQQFEEQRKKKMLQSYKKTLKEELAGSYKPKAFDEDTTDSNRELGKFVRHPDLMKVDEPQKPKKEPFWKEKEYFKKIKQEKQEKQEQAEKARQEKAQKYAEYKKKKQERFKKLSVKNKKGQPVMSLRMEMLLDKLQSGSK